MVQDIRASFKDDRVYMIFEEIAGLINVHVNTEGLTDDNLHNTIEEYIRIKFSDIADIQMAMMNDQLVAESALVNLSEKILAPKLFVDQKYERRHISVSRCPTCESKSPKKEPDRLVQVRPVGRAIRAVEFWAADVGMGEDLHIARDPDSSCDKGDVNEYLRSLGFEYDCVACGQPLDIVSSLDMLIPEGLNIKKPWEHESHIAALSRRSKLDERFFPKLVLGMLYAYLKSRGEDVEKHRHIDKYALREITNRPPREKENQFRKKFKRKYGVEIANGDIEDQTALAMLKFLQTRLGYGRRGLQDNINYPAVNKKSSITGREETFKMLQFPIAHSGYVFEAQIMPLTVFEREKMRTCGYNHLTYEMRAREGMQDLEERHPLVRTVNDAMKQLYSRRSSSQQEIIK